MPGLFDDVPMLTTAGASPPAPKGGLFDAVPMLEKPAEEGLLTRAARGADNVVRQVADGLTFGLADKFAAGMDAATGRGTYDQNVEAERAKTKAFADENPVTATAAQIAGGVLTGGALAKAGVTLLPRVADAGLKTRIGAGLVEGAGYGAAAGAGHTEGGIGDYAEGAAKGGSVGALIGGVLPGFGAGVRKVYELAEPLVRGSARELPRGAGGILSTAASADREALKQIGQLGPDAMLADAGPSFTGLAQGVAVRPGEGRSRLVEAVTTRNDGRTARLATDTGENLGPAESPIAATQKLVAERRVATAPMFRKAFDEAPGVDTTDVLVSIGQRLNKAEGAERSALIRARDMLFSRDQATGKLVAKVDAERLHNVKGEFDNLINYGDPQLGIAPGSLNREQGALKQVRGGLNDTLRTQVPGYAEANDLSRSFAQRAEAIERGTDVLAGGKTAVWPSDLAATMSKMAPEELAALKLGARADVENRVGTTANDLSALRKTVGGERDWNREKMVQVFGEEPTQNMVRAVDRESRFAQTYADVSRGSQTGVRSGADAAIEESAVSIPKNATMTGLAGNMSERLARAAFNGLVGMKSQADRAELGRLLSATGPERDKVIDALLNAADTRAAIGKALDQAIRHPAVLRAVAAESGGPQGRR